MPRMQLTDEEAALIHEHRRKTEIDRTHNAALDLASAELVELLNEEICIDPLSRGELTGNFTIRLDKLRRPV